jgi:hypothetical protein
MFDGETSNLESCSGQAANSRIANFFEICVTAISEFPRVPRPDCARNLSLRKAA